MVSALTYIKTARYIVMALAIYLLLAFLAFFLHNLFSIDYIKLELKQGVWIETGSYKLFGYEVPTGTYAKILRVDIITYLLFSTFSLIFFVINLLLLLIGVILIWVLNFFIIGMENGEEINPFALFRVLGMMFYNIGFNGFGKAFMNQDGLDLTAVGVTLQALNAVYFIFVSALASIIGVTEEEAGLFFNEIWSKIKGLV